jgi:hypothetical protein
LSAAYKGVHALLMRTGAQDFRSGQPFDQTVFFDENVDIHHIFPEAWCKSKQIKPEVYNSIVNKTPLSARTNRILGGSAPSAYLTRIESGSEKNPPLDPARLNVILESHEIEATRLRSDDFAGFMSARRERLLVLIESAMGKSAVREDIAPPDPEDTYTEEEAEAELNPMSQAA